MRGLFIEGHENSKSKKLATHTDEMDLAEVVRTKKIKISSQRRRDAGKSTALARITLMWWGGACPKATAGDSMVPLI